MTTETSNARGVHTCSYECERPACIRAQRDDLRVRLEAITSAQQPAAVDEEMVERGCRALCERWAEKYPIADTTRDDVRAVIGAALATQHQEPTT